MAVVRNLMVRAGADFSGMRKEMQRANQSVSKFKKTTLTALKLVASAYAVKKVIDYGRASVRAYNEAAIEAAKLERVMRNTMNATDDQIKGVKDLAAAQQKLGVVHTDIQLAGAQELGTYLSEANSLKTLLPTLNDMLAQQYGLDATAQSAVQIGTMIGKVMDGQLGALSRYGYSWTKAQEQMLKFGTEAQRAATLAAVVSQSVGGMNAALAKTPQGQMKQLAMTFADVRAQVGQGILPILQRVLPHIQAMGNAFLRAAQYVSAFTAALFGAQEVQQQTSAVQDLGDAYDEAGKKAKNSVSGFDQVNLVGGSTDGAGDVSGLAGVADAGGGFGSIVEQMGAVATKAKEMADKVRSAYGTISSFVRQHSGLIIAALAGVGTAFAGMWLAANGGVMAQGALSSMRGLAALANPIGLIAVAIAAVTAAGVLLWKNWDELDTKWKVLGTVLLGGVGIIVAIGKNFEWLKDNILAPIASFLSSVFVGAINGVTTATQWLWQAIQPVATALGGVLAPAFRTVADIAKAFWQLVLIPLGKAMKEGFVAAVEAVSTVLRTLSQKVIIPLASSIGDKLSPIVKAMGEAFVWVLNNALKPIVTYMSGSVTKIFTEAFKSIGGAIDGLKTSFVGLMNFITGVFTGDWRKAWNGVKDIFKGVFDSLWSIVKFPLNMIIDGINTLIGGLNKLSFDIPDGVPGFGGKSFGIDIPKIPKLAKGGLAFGPTLAMVGDNRGAATNPEVIAPLDKLESMISGGSDNKEVVRMLERVEKAVKEIKNIQAVISASEVTRAAVDGMNNITRRTGRPPITV